MAMREFDGVQNRYIAFLGSEIFAGRRDGDMGQFLFVDRSGEFDLQASLLPSLYC